MSERLHLHVILHGSIVLVVGLLRLAHSVHPFTVGAQGEVVILVRESEVTMGGRTTLWASYARFRTRWSRADGPQFAAYLPFYPAVSWLRIRGDEDVAPQPIRIFQGGADDWTPLAPIDAYVKRLRAAGRQNISLVEYEGAHHGFDNPRGAYPSTRYAEAANPSRCVFVEQADGSFLEAETGRPLALDLPCTSRGATTGYHPQAYEKAIRDVKAFLTEVFRETR